MLVYQYLFVSLQQNRGYKPYLISTIVDGREHQVLLGRLYASYNAQVFSYVI